MRNTVFKTVALGGLFSCLLALAVVFSGITDLVHATHDETPAITADQVVTEAELEQFVKEAADAYYIDFIMKHECDFSSIESLEVPGFGTFSGTVINGILPTTPTDQIKGFIPAFADLDIGDYCDFSQPFDEVFDREEGDWKSGSIYLFVMEDDGTLLFHGSDPDLENEVLQAIDADKRDVAQLIINKAKENPKEGGFVDYCWDDPAIEDDNVGGSDPAIAPGDSWKRNYVVDPFELLGINQPAGSSGVIFGSGIYPKTGTPPDGCKIYGGMEDPMEEMEDMQEPVEESMDEPGEGEMEPAMPTSVSGGGCAITAGSDSTPRNEVLNLLLIVSALFLAVSFRRRVTSKRNGVQF